MKLKRITAKKGKRPLKRKEFFYPFDEKNYTGSFLNNFPLKPRIKAKRIISNVSDLRELSDIMMKIPEFAYDTETNTLEVKGGYSDFKIVDISISWGEYHNYLIPIGHLREEDFDKQIELKEVVKYLKPVFEREDVRIIGHNLKFDMHVLKRIGIEIKTDDLFDTMLASWLCDENSPNGLKENSAEKMKVEQEHFKEATDTVPKGVKKEFGYKSNSRVPFDLVLIEDAAPYAIGDAFYTYMLYLGFVKELEDEGMNKIYYSMYIPFLKVLYEMEEQGVSVDVDKIKQMEEDMTEDIEDLTYQIYELAGVEFNIGSSQQKAEILFGFEKPDIPVMEDKAPKHVMDIRNDFQSGEITLEEAKEKLGKKGFYLDSKGKVWKESNKNKNVIAKSFGFPIQAETKGGSPSTDSDTIWRISNMTYKNKRKMEGVEMCKLMLEFSRLQKLKTAFVDGILDKIGSDNKVHPSFNQIGTTSGRLSCSNPNLQQLPNASDEDVYKIRELFIGSINEKGERNKIIAIDYHNLEMVCLTYFSKDRNLRNMFANGEDSHGSTAVNMFGLDCDSNDVKKNYPHLRQAAKTINFMLMYGGGAPTLYESLKSDHSNPLDLGEDKYLKEYKCKDGVEVAQLFIDKYFNSYSGVAKFISGQKKYAHKHGYVYTVLGRKRRLPDINSRDMKKSSYNERLSVNASIQGTAGDITINAQIKIAQDEDLKRLGCKMIIQVHDEIVFECPEENLEEAIDIIVDYMEHPFGFSENRQIPFLQADAGYGDSYYEAK